MAVLTDPISDFLTRFSNASRAGNEVFTATYTRIKADISFKKKDMSGTMKL